MPDIQILQVRIANDQDIILVRQRTKQIGTLCSLATQDLTRLVTAVSEIARNALQYAGGGKISYSIKEEAGLQILTAAVSDRGTGIPNIEEILSGHYQSNTGMGRGIIGSRALVDKLTIETSPNTGTEIKLEKFLSANKWVTPSMVATWASTLKTPSSLSAIEELEQQNKQLAQTLQELQESEKQLNRQLSQVQALNKQLDESRTVLAQKQNQLQEKTVELERANQLKGEFLANMSHEIRTPMNAILGLANRLNKSAADARQQQLTKLLSDAGNALLNVINDVLDISKIEAGKLDLVKAEFDLMELVTNTVALLSTQAQDKNLSLSVSYSNLLQTGTTGDAFRIRQILTNLVGNAIKFSDHGEVLIKVATEHNNNKQGFVRISVLDSGAGIPEDQQKHLFQPFFQLDGSSSRRHGGTGLGLSICKRLIEMMGGDFGVDSVQGYGSIFWFSLPLLSMSLSPDAVPATKVLLVEAASDARRYFTKLLEALACDVSEAADGIKALELAEPVNIAVISESIGVNAHLLCKELHRAYPSLRTVVLADSSDDRFSGTVLSKPITAGMLSNTFASIFPNKGFETFAVTLAHPEGKLESPNPVSSIAVQSGTRSAGKVLLVEDHPINQLVASMELQDMGFEVEVTDTGEKAVSLLESRVFDAVLMDCQLPGMDGYEATRLIRAREALENKHVPIIAMTAHAMEGDKQRCLDAGMDDYLSKPVDPATLHRLMDKWTKKAREVIFPEIKRDIVPIIESCIDVQRLAKRFRFKQIRELCQAFEDHTLPVVEQIQVHLAARDEAKLKVTTHTIRGASAILFADELAENCLRLDEYASAHRWEEAMDLYYVVIKLAKHVPAELRAFLDSTSLEV